MRLAGRWCAPGRPRLPNVRTRPGFARNAGRGRRCRTAPGSSTGATGRRSAAPRDGVTIAALIADPTRARARHQAAPINDSGEHLKGTLHPIPGWRLDSPEHVRTQATVPPHEEPMSDDDHSRRATWNLLPTVD